MDPNLEAIRAVRPSPFSLLLPPFPLVLTLFLLQKRMADLQASSSGGSGGKGMDLSSMGGGGDAEAAMQAAQQQAQEEETRRGMMASILSPDARERLSRIALVRPERAKSIEQLLMRMAQAGQLRGQVSEDQLIGVLDQVEAAEKGRTGGKADKGAGKIVFSRRKNVDSDDDFDL